MRGDAAALCQWLREHGAPTADVTALEDALRRDGTARGIDRYVAAWIANAGSAVEAGAWRLSTDVDARAITTRVLAYYGITIVSC